MARVFTITPGLENMGGLKTGGQGSIYKGRRTGEIVTAIKILPNSIFSESAGDKNYAAFENEVAKLKKVNETPNPNVVKILSSGITETGHFPYIEMEYIEGPDLEELLKPPHDPIFTIQETLKVAEQLANALAHCHKTDVKHGNIKSNNVKFNSGTGNYILLDFGLAIMSDEQRRSSIRHTGAIEFMAPEQNTGQMLFQTDVYSYGVILFELLTGTVPFPLKDKGETARNQVRLAHMAAPVPDVMELRRLALPSIWSDQKKRIEMQVPEWFAALIYKCLEKKPEKRFANGTGLYNYIVQQVVFRPGNAIPSSQITNPEQAKKHVVANQEELKKQLSRYRHDLIQKEAELNTLKLLLSKTENGLSFEKERAKGTERAVKKNGKVSTTSFVALLLVAIALAGFGMFPFLKKRESANSKIAYSTKKGKALNGNSNSTFDTAAFTRRVEQEKVVKQPKDKTETKDEVSDTTVDTVTHQIDDRENQTEKAEPKTGEVSAGDKPAEQKNDNNQDSGKTLNQTDENESTSQKTGKPAEENDVNLNSQKNSVLKKYLVVSKAYIYNDAAENTKRNEFISQADHAVVKALNERYGFIYVVITNPQGQVFKGWLRKRDLKLYSIE